MVESVVGLLNHTNDTEHKKGGSSSSIRSESFMKKDMVLGKVDRLNDEYLNN